MTPEVKALVAELREHSKRPGDIVGILSYEMECATGMSTILDALEKAEADAAALRNVLEDCHAHDIYANGDGAVAAELYRKSHGSDFGRVKDQNAHDHGVSMRKAVSGELGGELLDELRHLRAEVASGHGQWFVDAEGNKWNESAVVALSRDLHGQDTIASNLESDNLTLRAQVAEASACRCETLDATEGGDTDPRSCPEHAYEAGRRHERACYVEEKAELVARRDEARAELARAQDQCGIWERAADLVRATHRDCADRLAAQTTKASNACNEAAVRKVRVRNDRDRALERARLAETANRAERDVWSRCAEALGLAPYGGAYDVAALLPAVKALAARARESEQQSAVLYDALDLKSKEHDAALHAAHANGRTEAFERAHASLRELIALKVSLADARADADALRVAGRDVVIHVLTHGMIENHGHRRPGSACEVCRKLHAMAIAVGFSFEPDGELRGETSLRKDRPDVPHAAWVALKSLVEAEEAHALMRCNAHTCMSPDMVAARASLASVVARCRALLGEEEPSPPAVHLLHHGWALCGLRGVPGDWAAGHSWIGLNEPDEQKATCAGCKTAAETLRRTAPGGA